MPDLDYRDVFNLDYWEFLDLENIHAEDRDFIRDGCLVMILLMCLEYFEGCGTYVQDKLELCERRLSCVVPDTEQTLRLLTTVQLAVQLAQNEKTISQELNDSLGWVYRKYVQGYFRRIVREFDDNPYYGN